MTATTHDRRAALDGLLPTFAERAAAHDAEDTFVARNIEDLKHAGFYSAMVPAELGGGGFGHGEMVRALSTLARACPATALVASMHQHLVAASVWNARRGRPGEALLRRVASEDLALVSTGATDWLSSSGELVPVDGGYEFTARKGFSSGCQSGDLVLTSGRLGAEVLHFSLPLTTNGVRIDEDWRSLGMRGTGSHSILFEGAFVPEAAIGLRRPAGEWHPAWAVILTVALPLIMAAYVGVALEAEDIAVDAARRRGGSDLLASELGGVALARTSATTALDALVANANEFDFEPDVGRADTALRNKTLCARAVRDTVEAAFAVAGGRAFYRGGAGLERLLRDSFGAGLHPLPEARQRLFTGRLALGMDPVGDRAQAGGAAG